MGTKLYVGNLSFRTTAEELRDAFASVGTVESASVIEDRDTGRSRVSPSWKLPRRKKQRQPCHSTAKTLAANLTVMKQAREDLVGGGGGGRGGYGGGVVVAIVMARGPR